MADDRRIGQLLVREGVLTEAQLKEALQAQKESYGKPLGEVMLDHKIVDEPSFLRVLAKQFHTQYLTTPKLAELNVPDAILRLVPQAIAEKYNIFPVAYKKSERTLTIVTTDPTNVTAIDEIKFASGVGNIKTLVALKSSIENAIKKWYRGERAAFGFELSDEAAVPASGIETAGGTTISQMVPEDEDAPLDLSAIIAQAERSPPKPAVRSEPAAKDEGIVIESVDSREGIYLGGMDVMPGDDHRTREESSIIIEEVSGDSGVEEIEVRPRPKTEPERPAAPPAPVKRPVDQKKYRMRMLVVEDHPQVRKFIVKLFTTEGFRVKGFGTKEEALEELKQEEYDSLVIKEKILGEGLTDFEKGLREDFPGVELCIIKDYGSAAIGETRAYHRLTSSFLETLDVLAGLLEMEAQGFQGHTHNVAKYAKLIAGKLDMPVREVDAVSMAALVHDLGKKGLKHFTILQVDATSDIEVVMAQAEIPLKLLGLTNFPIPIQPILHHQFERWDGRGIPDGLKGEAIPVGARILALADTFEDLSNKYSGREAVEPSVALELLSRQAGKLFDPHLIEIFMSVVRDDFYLKQMETARDRILVADTEVDFTTLLELRLVNSGYGVIVARDGEDALAKARAEHPSLILTEVDLPRKDGFAFVAELQADEKTREIPVVFVSRHDDTKSVMRGLDLGAEDYITKPVKVDVLCAKVGTMMTRLKAEKKVPAPAAGVTGSLTEMSLPDIIQILGAGRKTGLVTLTDNGRQAQIFLEEGRIVNAKMDDLKGEEAFYKILFWNQGTFSIDPTVEISERLISMSNDSLMLEGFRRMDEAARGEAGGDKGDITLDGSDFF
ncbi:MAG: hypothetical protein A2V67_07580 [Deltaproteobacteria bacterium RBG_13_61_14]|nr:MAG: hypothetical protein A2V67_07580 [Deltaproteobacteria bacterium RBG_13_61_14]